MNKQELIDDLKGKSFVDGFSEEPILRETNSVGDKTYRISVREINGNVVTYRHVRFVVIDEGKAGERAFYLEKEPVDTVAEKTAIELKSTYIKGI